MAKYDEHEFFPDFLNLKVSELVVAIADASEERVGEAVTEALSIFRQRLKMDVVYVSEFVGDKRVLRYVDAPTDGPKMAPGDSDPLEETWCKMVVDGRIPEMIADVQAFSGKGQLPPAPFEIGTYMSTPVRLISGRLYGTICTISFSPNKAVQQRDLQTLRSVATLVARKIDMAHAESTRANCIPVRPSYKCLRLRLYLMHAVHYHHDRLWVHELLICIIAVAPMLAH